MRMSVKETIGNIDVERVTAWLNSVLVATLVEPAYFEAMGFAPAFVQRFLRKHDKVLRFDGSIDRKVRGVNELEFLRGLADVLGVRSLAEPWDRHDIATITTVAHRCAEKLTETENTQKAAERATDKDDPEYCRDNPVEEARS